MKAAVHASVDAKRPIQCPIQCSQEEAALQGRLQKLRGLCGAGACLQPQGHLQVLSGMVDYGMEPQEALDAPRFRIDGVDSCIGPASVNDSV